MGLVPDLDARLAAAKARLHGEPLTLSGLSRAGCIVTFRAVEVPCIHPLHAHGRDRRQDGQWSSMKRRTS
jgi:hypothetical protein